MCYKGLGEDKVMNTVELRSSGNGFFSGGVYSGNRGYQSSYFNTSIVRHGGGSNNNFRGQ